MPTARELLEQADALMRRNRTAALDDIPVLTDSVSMAGDRVPPPRVPEFPVPPTVAATTAATTAGIPTLTERAPPGGPDEPPDSMLQQGGEPSDWLEFEGAEPSVIGEAPDSVAIVPPVEPVRVADEVLLAAAEHEEIELTTPAEDAFDDEFGPRESPREVTPEPRDEESVEARRADRPAEPWPAAEHPAPISPAAPEPVDVQWAATVAEAPVAQAEAPPPIAVAFAEPAPPAPDVAVVPATFGWAPSAEAPAAAPAADADADADADAVTASSVIAAPMPAVQDFVVPGVPALPTAVAVLPPAAHPVIAEPEPSAPAAAAADDQPKWDAIAEEVRVQVLQRIDLFTDTGLRDQLGLRLKPIVDRASAELIATISLNVGELLRAYVAEAIEREIESWRRNH